MTALPATRAPGIYLQEETPRPAVGEVRMDVCAFVGVAPRGPCRVPTEDETWRRNRPYVIPDGTAASGARLRRSVAVPVESFGEYRRLYGGFDGPGRLPYAVASFFEQGGRRAYIVRIVHRYGKQSDGQHEDHKENAGGVAIGSLIGVQCTTGSVRLRARNEGRWGNNLRAALGYSATPLDLVGSGEQVGPVARLTVNEQDAPPVGSIIRVTLPGGAVKFPIVTAVRRTGREDAAGFVESLFLDRELREAPASVEIVEGVLLIDDGDGRTERHENLGLSSIHPRWMGTVLCHESELVYPDSPWIAADIVLDDKVAIPSKPTLDTQDEPTFTGGEDRYADITLEDFFDDSWVPNDPEPGAGVYALPHLADLSSVVVPDLYCPEPVPPIESVPDSAWRPSGEFQPCDYIVREVEEQEHVTPPLVQLHLDPGVPDDLEEIVHRQTQLAEFADRLRSLVVLLDVPPKLNQRQILRWRAHFRSSYVAAYHPWLRVSRFDDRRNRLIRVNPSAVAAGIIARQEAAFGVPHGPANVLAVGVLDVDEVVSSDSHDKLHPLGINVFLRERDGVRLSAARTLSRDPQYRQLSVRRLMLMLHRALEQQTQWTVFEPNGPSLRADVRNMIRSYLSRLYEIGAFTGATEEEGFFVRCDEELNPPQVIDAGRLVVEVGVAPAEPLEYIVLRITRGGDGTLAVEVD